MAFELPPLDYHAVRMRRLRAAIVDFVRRWSAYLAIAAVLFGAGSNAPLAAALSLASVLVSPLVAAAAHGAWIVAAVVGHAVAGALPVMLTRRLWWPRHWAEAERALPLAPDVLARSDRVFCVVLSAPWQVLLMVGGAGAWANGIDVRTGVVATLAAVASAVVSLVLASAWMRRVRQAATSRGQPRRVSHESAHAARPAPRTPSTLRPLGAVRALALLPLVRGRATRTAAALGLGTIATSACAAGPLWPSVDPGWPLALLALLAFAATSVLRASTVVELRPLWTRNRQWPLASAACERARCLLVLAPTLAALPVCAACVLTSRGARPLVFAGYAIVVAGGCAIEAATGAAGKPTDRAARWLLSLAIAIAFGSEVATRTST